MYTAHHNVLICSYTYFLLVVVVCWHGQMADGKPVRIGAKVDVVGKGVIGTVAYIGTTLFSSGYT